MRKTRKKWKDMLRHGRINIFAFLVLVILASSGLLLLRTKLLQNAQSLGMSLSRNYAAEESNNLTVYKTLLSFGTQSMETRIKDGLSEEELSEWIQMYFQRLQAVLGVESVDPYAVINGKIIAANPWEDDDTYNIYETQWYQRAIAAEGEVIFTDVYTDAIYNKPVITIAQKCANINGLLAFDIFPESLQFQVSLEELPEGSSFFLCDASGTLIYNQTDLIQTDHKLQSYISGVIEKINAGELYRYDTSVVDLEGNRRAVYYTAMDNGWISMITIPYSSILGDLYQITVVFSILFGLFFVAVIWLSWRDLKLNERIDRTNETVRVLGNSYYALYRVNVKDDTYEMIKGSKYIRSRIQKTGKYEILLNVMGEIIEPDAYHEYMESFSLQSMRKLLSKRIRNFGGDFQRQFGDEYRWVNVRVLFDESLEPQEAVLCFREVEEEKNRQLQERKLLQNALENARQSEKAKQAFFSNMSHDMRTPLNAIIGLSDLVSQYSKDPQKVSEYIEKINFSSNQLLNLINDILDMSRFEQGKVILDNQQFDLKKCIEDSMAAFRLQADKEKKNFMVSFQIDDSYVLGDSLRMSQILNNLVSNALKFTDEGDSISVEIKQLGRDKQAKYKIVVKDSGLGMSKDFLPRLFEPYARETRFSGKEISGTGLGMPIVKNLVTQMSGQIQVESELGKGSTFTVVLPFLVVNANELIENESKVSSSREISLEGRNILLAEDNLINMEIATEMLTMYGIKVTQAWNGIEAVDLFQSSPLFTYDAILMDMQMPQMDGCEAAKKIRSLSRPDATTVPIVAVTANAFTEDIAQTTSAGMNAHISKPIDFLLLCQTLSKLMMQSDR